MYDEIKAAAISDLQYRTCQQSNTQFCRINAPFQPLTNLPSCVTTLYAKNDQAVKEQCSLVIFHMPHTYRWVPLKPDFLGTCKSVWLITNLAYLH